MRALNTQLCVWLCFYVFISYKIWVQHIFMYFLLMWLSYEWPGFLKMNTTQQTHSLALVCNTVRKVTNNCKCLGWEGFHPDSAKQLTCRTLVYLLEREFRYKDLTTKKPHKEGPCELDEIHVMLTTMCSSWHSHRNSLWLEPKGPCPDSSPQIIEVFWSFYSYSHIHRQAPPLNSP